MARRPSVRGHVAEGGPVGRSKRVLRGGLRRGQRARSARARLQTQAALGPPDARLVERERNARSAGADRTGAHKDESNRMARDFSMTWPRGEELIPPAVK